ncbi:MAG: hypothetical protein ACRDBG_07685 [Waterburya sp.]
MTEEQKIEVRLSLTLKLIENAYENISIIQIIDEAAKLASFVLGE